MTDAIVKFLFVKSKVKFYCEEGAQHAPRNEHTKQQGQEERLRRGNYEALWGREIIC